MAFALQNVLTASIDVLTTGRQFMDEPPSFACHGEQVHQERPSQPYRASTMHTYGQQESTATSVFDTSNYYQRPYLAQRAMSYPIQLTQYAEPTPLNTCVGSPASTQTYATMWVPSAMQACIQGMSYSPAESGQHQVHIPTSPVRPFDVLQSRLSSCTDLLFTGVRHISSFFSP